jgi:hypothetical protein
MSALTITLIVMGVILVLGLGTCVAGAFFLKQQAENLVDGGGLVLASPPEVKAELAGAKKDYVGSWRSTKGSSLDIDAEGNIKMILAEGSAHESVTAAIAAFKGNDIEIHAIVTLAIPVTSTPHAVGDHVEMTAKGVTFQRK